MDLESKSTNFLELSWFNQFQYVKNHSTIQIIWYLYVSLFFIIRFYIHIDKTEKYCSLVQNKIYFLSLVSTGFIEFYAYFISLYNTAQDRNMLFSSCHLIPLRSLGPTGLMNSMGSIGPIVQQGWPQWFGSWRTLVQLKWGLKSSTSFFFDVSWLRFLRGVIVMRIYRDLNIVADAGRVS